MRSRTVSAIQTEANYLRHRIERVSQSLVSMHGDERSCFTEGQANAICKQYLADLDRLRAALARCERELGGQGQVSIENTDAMEFTLL